MLLCGLVLLAPPVLADNDCRRDPQTFTLKIKLKQNKPVAVTHKGKDAEIFHVCMGDTIEWKISGWGRKDFYVEFERQVPTNGPAKKPANNGKILVTIAGGDARPGGDYKYLIGVVGGGEWDPRVIVDR